MTKGEIELKGVVRLIYLSPDGFATVEKTIKIYPEKGEKIRIIREVFDWIYPEHLEPI